VSIHPSRPVVAIMVSGKVHGIEIWSRYMKGYLDEMRVAFAWNPKANIRVRVWMRGHGSNSGGWVDSHVLTDEFILIGRGQR